MEAMEKAKKRKYKTIPIDKKKISNVRKRMKSDRSVQQIVKALDALGGTTRSQIVHALSFGELYAQEIAILLNATRSAIAHQFRPMRNMGLVKCRREGRFIFYSLNPEGIKKVFDEFLRQIRR